MVRLHIQRQDTVMRESFSGDQRLALTLRFLATGESLHSLSFAYRVGRCTASGIVKDTCTAIYNCMKGTYLKMPDTPEKWKNIDKDFNEKWNYPFCVGALDGKHVRIKNPKCAGPLYFNYKKFYSIVLLALVDANYRF
ncbi:hypothetical protein SNE40_001608 [Patella caerulea]|uniref:DDE Tnp4 domain-containing protein n=1 Tax=Patella caerulea TaxID=87958 RepID=A0AAN8KHZ5_PATCE